jgi:uncharacterized membrane protein YbhN (UPF0104 family)
VLSTSVRKILNWSGSALSVLAIIFVVGKLQDYGTEIEYSLIASLKLPLILLSVAFGTANLLLAIAWKDLMKHFGVSVDTLMAIRVYGVSQLAKYVPGNIFHFVGRQALGLNAGLPAWPLAKSVIWEIGVLSISGSLFIILVSHYFYAGIPIILALGLFLLAVLLTLWISSRWFSRWIMQAIGFDILFLILSGVIFLAVLSLVIPSDAIPGSEIMIVCGAYVVAWLAGLITPGAPAGVGIREFVLYAILHPFVNEADLLAAIIFGRIVTVSGDVLFYLMAVLANARTRESA